MKERVLSPFLEWAQAKETPKTIGRKNTKTSKKRQKMAPKNVWGTMSNPDGSRLIPFVVNLQ